MDDSREQHQAELERGITLQLTPELERSAAWRRVQLAAAIDGRTVSELVADGIMTVVECYEDEAGPQLN